MDIAETDFALKAVSKIFDVIVWNKNIPLCYFQWMRNNFLDGVWQLKVIPFKPIICKSKIESNGFVDVEYFDCGFKQAVKGDSMGGFKNKHIAKGDHENLHQIIHRLGDSGIDFAKIEIEQRFKGYIVDVLGEIDKKYIAVELGKLSDLGKFLLVDEESVKELWFGDDDRFIYSLSRKAPCNKDLLRKEADSFLLQITNYYKTFCEGKGQLSSCLLSPYSAWNCIATRRAAKDFLGIE